MEDIQLYLNTFNKKLNKLLTLKFSQKLDLLDLIFTQNEKSIHIFKNGELQILGDNIKSEKSTLESGLHHNGPSGEEIDAYILTLRFFIQNNDALSIRNWSEKIDKSNLPNEINTKAILLREELNQVLDERVLSVKIENGRKVLTTREIIETYVYGEYAHTNTGKNNLFNELDFGNDDNLSFILRTKQVSEIFKKILQLNIVIIDYVS